VDSDGPCESYVGWGPVMLRDVPVATNFGTKVDIVWTIVTRQLVMEWVRVVG